MKHTRFSGKYQDGKNTVEMNLPVMLFEEDGTQIAYLPMLDVSGYGNTEDDAIDSLKTSVDLYLKYTLNKKTLLDDLRAHGWIVKKKTKPFIAPELTDILSKNEYLHDIVNNKRYRMDRVRVDMPQCA